MSASLAVVGAGLVSPLGVGLREHAFLVRARIGLVPRSPFVDAEGERIDVSHCAFLGATMPWEERLARLAEIAAHEALDGTAETRGTTALAVVAPRSPRIEARVGNELRAHLQGVLRIPTARTFGGAAGAFAALDAAREWSAQGVESVLVVGVDSLVDAALLGADREETPSVWIDRSPAPSEGAAAFLLSSTRPPPRATALVLAGSGAALGRGCDDDDLDLDGAAMTALLRALPERDVELVLGQEYVDELRTRDFHLASARVAARFAADVDRLHLERHTGRLGAAAGVFQVAMAFAASRHRTIPVLARPRAEILCWAISRDGWRGVALFEARTT